MNEIILAKMGELALKGLNRSTFESILVKNIRRRLEGFGSFEIRKAQSVITIEPKDPSIDLDEAVEKVSQVFGIVALSRAMVAPKEMDAILDAAPGYLEETLENAKTFKVEAKRSDKTFPLKSPAICAAMGEKLLQSFPHLKVDVHHPDVTVMVEIRDFGAYIHGKVLPGAGGMPVGTGGRGLLLISGGIDSPVAGYMMAKRGLRLTAIHFASPPYTSERAERKVIELLTQVAGYAGRMKLLIVPFTSIQEAIRDNCPEDLFTVVMRRFMVRIASAVAEKRECLALVTGESVGQVASQTLPAMVCTDAVAQLPVLRPLCGMDKEEIMEISRKIGTFDISIQPYEDCCTVFTPKHPKTRPRLSDLEAAEQKLSLDQLVQEAVEGVREMVIEAR
ncbi:tRNA uracil 4-sulfurtransferase ThiI [Solibaculum mannosilyticum]|uniref:Probable tRNA sulfurtransferase n=1 Tax=Solibaculum mannosilyticum TaxID=2780922 RepID=A0A7I8DA46_9FIRM|nr:tRNA uracil 4-sulfurtransferase ThiI [Solibaculum mannosilyticum]BCI61464.1 putative tRNA sulfurtransferase [Solibaculum mannosilyticum]